MDEDSPRLDACNAEAVNRRAGYVLYWMRAFRRPGWNFSLDRAIDWGGELRKPLAVVETLSCDGRWANDRMHAFVLRGMAENAEQFERNDTAYYPYVEPEPGRAVDLVAALADKAAVVVTDDYPIGESVEQLRRVVERVGVRIEEVDSNGLLPVRLADRTFSTAQSFRRFVQRSVRDYLLDFPSSRPLAGAPLPRLGAWPRGIARGWPRASKALLRGDRAALAALPIDHEVAPVAMVGGWRAGTRCLKDFLAKKLAHYAERRNHPDADATSGLSPYLHFGHTSTHEVFRLLAQVEQWSPGRLGGRATGSCEGWWRMSAAAEAFLDQLITWRELGFNMTQRVADYDRYESLPDWAKTTLAQHAGDRREHVYTLAQFEHAQTHDPLWNAAQRELVAQGRMHNYLRMLWGKKILQWSASPPDALEVMIELNNKYALDGQDPNSYSGIFWTLGRYDRAWGPERPVFGKIRYMTSENTARKIRLKNYLKQYGSTADDSQVPR